MGGETCTQHPQKIVRGISLFPLPLSILDNFSFFFLFLPVFSFLFFKFREPGMTPRCASSRAATLGCTKDGKDEDKLTKNKRKKHKRTLQVYKKMTNNQTKNKKLSLHVAEKCSIGDDRGARSGATARRSESQRGGKVVLFCSHPEL